MGNKVLAPWDQLPHFQMLRVTEFNNVLGGETLCVEDPQRIYLAFLDQGGAGQSFVTPKPLSTFTRGYQLDTGNRFVEFFQYQHGPLVACSFTGGGNPAPRSIVVVEIALRDFPEGIANG